MLELIYLVRMQDKGENILVWNEDRKGSFRVKPYYSSLCSKTRVDFPAKEIQGSQAPLTMLFFSLGKQYQGKILTIEMLMKRKWMMVNRCGLCKANNHILIHCERTRQLWTFLLAIFSLKWVFPAIIKNLLLKWKFRRHVWQMDPLCLLWCI